KQVSAHDPNPLPKTNQDRIVRAEKLMSSDPSRRQIGVCRQRRDRFPCPLSGQGNSAIQRAQDARLSLRHQWGGVCRCLARKDRRTVAVQLGHAENSRLRQGHVVDGLQFLCGAVARCLRSAPLRNGAGPDAANLPSVLQTQLRRKSSATPYWASFHEL